METGLIDNGAGSRIAWQSLAGRSPCIVFFPGFRSDMSGDKARSIARLCAQTGQALMLFDYSGHGASDGNYEDGTISAWRDDALRVVDALVQGPILIVGSSMGGWIGLLVALARASRVVGFVGIAAAPDFTETLIWRALTSKERASLLVDGHITQTVGHQGSYTITRALIEDGRQHLVMGRPISLPVPVRLLHGQADTDVGWETSLKLASNIASPDVHITIIKDGEHRLSREKDLAVLATTLLGLIQNRA